MRRKEYKQLSEIHNQKVIEASQAFEKSDYSLAISLYNEIIQIDHNMIENWTRAPLFGNQPIDSLKSLSLACQKICEIKFETLSYDGTFFLELEDAYMYLHGLFKNDEFCSDILIRHCIFIAMTDMRINIAHGFIMWKSFLPDEWRELASKYLASAKNHFEHLSKFHHLDSYTPDSEVIAYENIVMEKYKKASKEISS